MPPENPRSQVEARNVTDSLTEADFYLDAPETARSKEGYPIRYVTHAPETARSSHSTAEPGESQERFRLMRLCPCETCGGIGKTMTENDRYRSPSTRKGQRCHTCRGEGRTLEEVATCPTEAAVGLALIQLGREGEFDECPFGLIDSEGEVGLKWLVSPWLPSPRNISDAGRVLRSAQTGKGKPQ